MTLLDDTRSGAPAHSRTFSVWAPNADRASVVLYDDDSDEPNREIALTNQDGTWCADVAVAAGTQYLFRIGNGDVELLRIDPRAREVTSSVGRAIVPAPVEPDDGAAHRGERRPLAEWVVYELHPGTFGSTLDGAAERLGHMAALGATAVEVMPVAEFAGDVSWGYNPALPFAIESSYGGPPAMRRFVEAAHALGLAVIVDVVYNHFGPSDLDLWRFDGWSEDDGGIYFYNDWRAATPWGDTRPDYGRSEVRDYILDNVRMWLDDYGVDGLRLDMIAYIRNAHGHAGSDGDLPEGWDLLRAITDTVHTEFPGVVVIGEDLQRDPRVTAPTADGGLGFDLQWAAGFVHPVRAALGAVDDAERDLDAVAAAWLGGADPAARVVYTESHDEVANGRTRVPAEIDGDDPDSMHAFRRSAIGAVLTMTAPGVPMLFQGQEWGDEDWFDDARPLQWERAGERAGTVQMWRDLVALRTGADGRAGGLRGDRARADRAGPDGRVLVLQRWGLGGPEAACLVVVNLSAAPVEADISALVACDSWTGVFASDWSGYHASGGDAVPPSITSTVCLPAYGSAVYVRDVGDD